MKRTRWLWIAWLATVFAGPASAQQAPVTLTLDPTMIRGAMTARVTIVEFSDYQCPYCRSVQQVLDRILAEYPGRVRLAFKDFPLPGHALARPAHEAARCAGTFKRYWEYHDRLFAAQPDFSRSRLLRHAAELGLPAETFARCLDGGQTRALVEADVEQGRRLGVSGTPTFFINGTWLEGAQPHEAFKEVIDAALRKSEGR